MLYPEDSISQPYSPLSTFYTPSLPSQMLLETWVRGIHVNVPFSLDRLVGHFTLSTLTLCESLLPITKEVSLTKGENSTNLWD